MIMDKFWFIIKWEYFIWVICCFFILVILLILLAFGLFFVVVGLIFQYESDDFWCIVIIDEGNIFDWFIKDEENLYFKFVDMDLEIFC